MASAEQDLRRSRGWWRKIAVLCGVAAYAWLHAPASTEPAIANGDTRTLTFVNNHTNEQESFTYRVNGSYDDSALEKMNWFMRDWRLNEQTKMDPHLFDILWEVYQQSGSSQPIDVLSAYRSPQTNSMLRRRSRLVAEHSQHMQGKAIDAHFIDVGPGPIRDIAMRMQEGGVGFYPIGSTPWIHVDSGTVRYWPRMSRSSMARLFPDGKTVFIPADGQPMEGYAEAKAMIESRGGDVQTATSSSGGLFSWLFGGARGGGEDDAEETAGASVLAGRGGAGVGGAGGRGGAQATVAYSEPERPSPPVTSAEPLPVAAPTAIETPSAEADAVASVAADDAAPVEAAFRAPLPPRKPAQMLIDLASGAPQPPRRPTKLAVGEPADSSSGDDVIATLIERDALPNAITKGVHGTPKAALALTDTHSDDPGDALLRAAALSPPPLPPSRPRAELGGVTTAAKSAPLPLRPSRATRPSAQNPFGSLVVDNFNAPASSEVGKALSELRGTSP